MRRQYVRVRDSTLRALAIAAKKQSPLLPDVPTTAEAGAPGFESHP
ncbi:tripartite tricarboxylate transporter substrate-binding protein [Pigmentiphaga sp.]